jgi:hypothetical protein
MKHNKPRERKKGGSGKQDCNTAADKYFSLNIKNNICYTL